MTVSILLPMMLSAWLLRKWDASNLEVEIRSVLAFEMVFIGFAVWKMATMSERKLHHVSTLTNSTRFSYHPGLHVLCRLHS